MDLQTRRVGGEQVLFAFSRAAFLRTSRRVHVIVAVTRKDLEEICVRAEKVRERALETLDTVRETRWRCETERQRSRQPVQEPTGRYLASFEDGAGGRTPAKLPATGRLKMGGRH